MNRDAATPADALREVLSGLEVPDALLRSWALPTPAPERGTLWRADWNETMLLVVVTATSPSLTVAPVTVEPSLSGRDTLRFEADQSTLGVVTHAWLDLEVEVGTWVLGHFAGRVATDLIGEGSPMAGAAEPKTWEPASTRLYRAMLRDQCEALRVANWQVTPQPGKRRRLQDLVSFEVLANVVNEQPQRALALWRDQVTLTSEEAHALAASLGITTDDLPTAAPTLPDQLIAELESPVRGQYLRSIARARQLRIEDAYRAVATEAFALAARQTGAREPDWGLRLDALLADARDINGGLGE